MYKVIFHGVVNTAMFDASSNPEVQSWRKSVTGFGRSDLEAFKAVFEIVDSMEEQKLVEALEDAFDDGEIGPSSDELGSGWNSFHAVTICWGGKAELVVVSDADDGDAA